MKQFSICKDRKVTILDWITQRLFWYSVAFLDCHLSMRVVCHRRGEGWWSWTRMAVISAVIMLIMIELTLPKSINSKCGRTQSVNTQRLAGFFNDCYSLWVHRPPVQLSVASATPSQRRPPCLGSGAVHSLLRCLSQSDVHADHSLHSLQPPSTDENSPNDKDEYRQIFWSAGQRRSQRSQWSPVLSILCSLQFN